MSPPFPPTHSARPPSDSRRRQKRATRRIGRLLGLLAVLAVVSALALRFRLVWVVGDSMLPTYRSGDLIVVDTWAYRSGGPVRGDVVVARHHDGWVVKRVVGLPGESVEVREGRVEVQGVRLDVEPDVEPDGTPGPLNIGAARLLEQRFAILGDNRGGDPATFIHAVVGPDQLLGKVVLPDRLISGPPGK